MRGVCPNSTANVLGRRAFCGECHYTTGAFIHRLALSAESVKLTAHTLCIYINRLFGKPDFLQLKALPFPN